MGRLIFGGTFNPVHIGHLRLAIETMEHLKGLAQICDFVPAAQPPHKKMARLLPFSMRARMVNLAIQGLAGMRCNDLEARRSGPSYTWDTLCAYKAENLQEELYFLLGSTDYALLPEWRNGLRLPELCHLVVAPRGEFGQKDFEELTRVLWPEAQPCATSPVPGKQEISACAKPPMGHKIFFLNVTWLDISSTRFRQLWLERRNTDFLAPAPVLAMLQADAAVVREYWQEKTEIC